MNILKYLQFINENKSYDDFFIIYKSDRFVYHITSKTAAEKILKSGFKIGYELNISEKRKAIYFSDKSVNCGLYARNKEGEIYENDDIGEVEINLKNLKLLNMSYRNVNSEFENHKKYKDFVVRGEIDKIPFDIDGTISFLEDGRIYEVCLKKEIANKLI